MASESEKRQKGERIEDIFAAVASGTLRRGDYVEAQGGWGRMKIYGLPSEANGGHVVLGTDTFLPSYRHVKPGEKFPVYRVS